MAGTLDAMKTVRCLQGIHNWALDRDELPTRIKILRWGENPAQGGSIIVDDTTAAALAAQIADPTTADVMIDFEHASVPGSPTYQKDPRKHAGTGRLDVVPGDGIYLTDIQWTPTGREFAREYPDLSPAVRLAEDGRTVVYVHSVALTTHGALHDVTFFAAADRQECDHIAPDGTFVGGFDGCVEHFTECEGLPEENARKLCAYIGRHAGKITSASAKKKRRRWRWKNLLPEFWNFAESCRCSGAPPYIHTASASQEGRCRAQGQFQVVREIAFFCHFPYSVFCACRQNCLVSEHHFFRQVRQSAIS